MLFEANDWSCLTLNQKSITSLSNHETINNPTLNIQTSSYRVLEIILDSTLNWKQQTSELA